MGSWIKPMSIQPKWGLTICTKRDTAENEKRREREREREREGRAEVEERLVHTETTVYR
jgi:hypothetical protein